MYETEVPRNKSSVGTKAPQIDLAGADYLTDNDEISVIFFWTDYIAEGYHILFTK